MMNRKTAIDKYVHSLEGYEVYNILDAISNYDCTFDDFVWFPIEDFDKVTENLTHTQLMRCEGAYFNICCPWFRFNSIGELESANTEDICAEALDAVPDLVYYCVQQAIGHTGDSILDDLINAYSDDEFDEFYNRI